jgi:2,3-bisphosphoglycerate-dependent phosphoglycerate mutase
MQFYCIRHAQSENNLLYVQTGSVEGRSADPELTPVGWQQAEALARFLSRPGLTAVNHDLAYDPQNLGGFTLTHLYCSLMVRAVATGMVVARALNLPLVAWEDVHEVGGIHEKDAETGERAGLPGNNQAYFETHYPALVLPESLGQAGWWNRPFEDHDQRPLRARRFWEELLAKHGDSDDRVAVISHGGFYRHLMWVILDCPEEEAPWFALNNAAITRIDLNSYGLSIQYMNRLDFVPRDLVT